MTKREKQLVHYLIIVAVASIFFLGLYIGIAQYWREQVYLATQAALPIHQTANIKDWNHYINSQYGFELTLTDSWKGYSVVPGQWNGYLVTDSSGKVAETGPKITLRNPQWDTTKEEIPIMVFTQDQWNLVIQEKLAVSVARFHQAN